MNFVTIFKTLNSVDADLAASRLAAAGFHPEIVNESVGLSPGGILVQVPEDEAGDAQEFLADSGQTPQA